VTAAAPWLPATEATAPPVPGRTAWICHGILGSKLNWRTFARRLAGALPGWSVLTIDHRHHGDSRGAPPPDTVAACAADLARLAAHSGVPPRLLIGHSFGGKVVLEAAEHLPFLKQVWVLDTPPGAEPGAGARAEVRLVLDALRAAPLPLARREDIVPWLEGRGFSAPLARWMTTNLEPAAGGGFTWRFDLAGATRLIDDYFQRDDWARVRRPPPGVEVHVVRAARSDRWSADDDAALAALRPPAYAHTLADAGHWLHFDNPEGLLRLIAEHQAG